MAADLRIARDGAGAPAIDFMPLATLIAEAGSRVLAVNAAWVQLSGLAEDRSLDRGWLDLVAERDRDRIQRAVHRVLDGGGLETLEQEIDGGGGSRWTRWTFRRHDCQGRPVVVMVVVDLDAEHHLQVDLRHRATHDALTGLVNRAEFLDLTGRAVTRQEGRVGVVYMDLDRFKAINDEGGHQLGDRVLAAAARRLRTGVRPADVVGRVGGDEFAVLCHDLTHAEDLEAVAGRLRAVMKAPLEVDGHLYQVGVSTGVAVSSPDLTPEDLLDAADRAMYAAKSRRYPVPSSAVVRAGGLLGDRDHGRGRRRPAPGSERDRSPGPAEELLQHLYNARLSLESCATAVGSGAGAVEDLWSAIDEVDAVLSCLSPEGPRPPLVTQRPARSGGPS